MGRSSESSNHPALEKAEEERRRHEEEDFVPGLIDLACLLHCRQQERAALNDQMNALVTVATRTLPECNH